MKQKKKDTDKKLTPENANKQYIAKLKNKMKHQKDALNKILKNIQNEKDEDN